MDRSNELMCLFLTYIISIFLIFGIFFVGAKYTIEKSERQYGEIMGNNASWVEIKENWQNMAVFCARYGIDMNNCNMEKILHYVNNSKH